MTLATLSERTRRWRAVELAWLKRENDRLRELVEFYRKLPRLRGSPRRILPGSTPATLHPSAWAGVERPSSDKAPSVPAAHCEEST